MALGKHEKTLKTKTKRQRLTEASIQKLRHNPSGSSWQVVWDTKVDNLGVRVGVASKRWVLRYRNAAGNQRLWSFGSTTQIPVRRARELAQEANVRIVRGEDPSVQKRTKRAQDDPTLKALFRSWIDEYAAHRRRSWCRDKARLLAEPDDVITETAKNVRRNAPIHMVHHLRASDGVEVIEEALVRVHQLITQRGRPGGANKLLRTVRTALNWHVKRRNLPQTFRNITNVIDMNPACPRVRHLRPPELEKFAAATLRLPLTTRCAVWLMLLTGARSTSEVLALRWEDVHLDVGELVFPMTKNGKEHRLPITPAIRHIFDAIPKTPTWVFPRRDGTKPISSVRTAFSMLAEANFIDHITAHALRHTARTLLETKCRIPGPTVDAVLNHATRGMASTYCHVTRDDVYEALVELEQFILDAALIEDFDEFLRRGVA